ncbi:MAG: hypothetical protein NZM29_08175, partial [Nitrospira sp.]|nr:hypothetical protein [Nitrospira sp.]
AMMVVVSQAHAVVVSWTDWTSSSNQFSASGTLLVDSTRVDVQYSGTGAHRFVQTGTGRNYWTGPAYTQGAIENPPPASELVALWRGGRVTITFSQTVQDPFIALVSWNGNRAEFGVPIEFDSVGHGYWGSGTPVLNAAGTGFFGRGELHGVIRLSGTYDSITFTHTTENWHGFTVGVAGLANPIPIPAAAWLFGSGVMGLIGLRKIRK